VARRIPYVIRTLLTHLAACSHNRLVEATILKELKAIRAPFQILDLAGATNAMDQRQKLKRRVTSHEWNGALEIKGWRHGSAQRQIEIGQSGCGVA
jgi:hypothetical protein